MGRQIANDFGAKTAVKSLCYESGKALGRARTSGWVHRLAPMVAAYLLLSGCSNPGDTALSTKVPLNPVPNPASAAMPGVQLWRSPDLSQDEQHVSAYFIPSVTVFRGTGSDYVDMTSQQIDAVAAELTSAVQMAVRRRFKVVNAPGPGVFTLDLTLVKVVLPHPVELSSGPYPFLDPKFGVPEAGQRIDNGLMTVAGKFLGGPSNKMLFAFVVPVSPQNMNFSGQSSPTVASNFVQASCEQFANNMVAAIVRQRQIKRSPTGG